MGLKPEEFWRLTRAEFFAMREGHIERQKRQTNESRYESWHIARWIIGRGTPKLEEFLLSEKTQTKAQTPDQMLAALRMITILSGGKVVQT